MTAKASISHNHIPFGGATPEAGAIPIRERETFPSSLGGAANPTSQAVAGEGLPAGSPGPAETADEFFSFPQWKRGFDIIVVVLTLPCWLPLMGLVALGIWFGSGGPVLFAQERVGYRGRRFMCLKFRSMKVNVETQSHESHFERLVQSNKPMTKLDASGDPRLIPCGRLLRATCLDELPQIFNVLRGEMSLVGPRPCTVSEFRLYESWQQARVGSPPGLTGYWQVHGKNRTTFSEMIAMDTHYVRHVSVWMDIKVIVRTIPAIAGQVYRLRVKKSAANNTAYCTPVTLTCQTGTRKRCI